ncbi:hypothetical protein A0256_04095 [Mucilaginibacter sp. PAMC 26640]|nr:hypothetical protein A0256_04095 [Mucilaginibacter sp. PAMC 26640]
MEDFTVKMDGGVTIIESHKRQFRMSVQKDRQVNADRNTALMDATLYKEQGSFVRDCSYIFEALNIHNEPLVSVDIELFKNAVDFFFTSVLGTDLYVKSIPRSSSLCGQHLKAFQFDIR